MKATDGKALWAFFSFMLLKLEGNSFVFLFRVSRNSTRAWILNPRGFSKIKDHELGNEDRVSRGCQLTFERHCSSSSSPTKVVLDAS